MAVLLFQQSGREILRFPLIKEEVLIGRHPDNDLTLPDESISRFHVVIALREDGYWLIDKSRNGITLNGGSVSGKTPLKLGDIFTMGPWSVHFLSDTNWSEKETLLEDHRKKRKDHFYGMIGKSIAMKKVFEILLKMAPTTETVLIQGETGTGKELVAGAIHEISPRRANPFVAINCGSISPQLIESELFGHEKGSFTGAFARHVGAFEQAQHGTLFLDEIGELPLELQPKLLRVLEEHCIRRVGGTQEVSLDVRIIAATHRNLVEWVQEGRFREDLYYRLFSLPIVIPPLRERVEDIPLLSDFFVRQMQGQNGGTRSFSPEALEKLKTHAWRGNVRELKNVITRSLLFSTHDEVRADEVLFLTMEQKALVAQPTLQKAERDVIATVLRENDGNRSRAAERLGIAKSTLYKRMKDYGLE